MVQKVIERIVLVLILLALVISVVGLIMSNSETANANADKFTNTGLIILIIVALAYAGIQVALYVMNGDKEKNVQLLVFAIVTSVVAIAILCVGTLILMGKIF